MCVVLCSFTTALLAKSSQPLAGPLSDFPTRHKLRICHAPQPLSSWRPQAEGPMHFACTAMLLALSARVKVAAKTTGVALTTVFGVEDQGSHADVSCALPQDLPLCPLWFKGFDPGARTRLVK